DDAEELAGLDREGDVTQCTQVIVPRSTEGVQCTLLERVHLLTGDGERLRDAVHEDSGARRHSLQGIGVYGCAASRTAARSPSCTWAAAAGHVRPAAQRSPAVA